MGCGLCVCVSLGDQKKISECGCVAFECFPGCVESDVFFLAQVRLGGCVVVLESEVLVGHGRRAN